MNVETIKMSPYEARRKLEAYGRALKRRANVEYEACRRGYEKLAQGKVLINLRKAIVTGGWDERGRPRLAVARADRRRVECSDSWPGLTFSSGSYRVSGSLLGWSLPLREMPERPEGNCFRRIHAIVPLVPPDLGRFDLTRRLILWEAEWTEPPRDPILLLPLGGDLCAVEAAWNLTDLERAVIGRTRSVAGR